MADEDLSKLRIDKSDVPAHRGKKKRYFTGGLILLSLVTAGALYRNGVLTPAKEVQVVSVQNLFPSQTFTLLNASGYVVAQRKAAVASKITGRIVYLGVEEGSRVKQGEIIARMENDDAVAARDQAIANVRLARMNLQQAKVEVEDALNALRRKRNVVRQGYVSELEFEAAEARHRKAEAAVAAQEAAIQASEAALREASVTLEYSNIRAPFDAVVLTKSADIGDIVTPLGAAANAKAAVVTIADMDSLQVEADVSESNIGQVKVGQPCEILLDALPDRRFSGKVHMIVPTADRSKSSVMVKVAFEEKDPRILPEMSAKVAFLAREIAPEEQKAVRTVPVTAVVEGSEEKAVFVVENDQARRSAVRIGRRFDNVVEIVEGVEIGERVIVSPKDIQDHDRVKIPEE